MGRAGVTPKCLQSFCMWSVHQKVLETMAIPKQWAPPTPGMWSLKTISHYKKPGLLGEKGGFQVWALLSQQRAATLPEAIRVTVTRLGTSLNKLPGATDRAK